jgi:hypothetical protein
VLTGALALVLFTGVRAWTISPVPGPSTDAAADPVPQLGGRAAYRLADALRAVARDPFHPERRAPVARYLLPEDGAQATLSVRGSVRGEAIRLLGTVVSGASGGFVMCQIGREPPKTLHVGDTLGGLTLRRVERAAAEFTDGAGTVVLLRVPGAPAPEA